VGVELTGKLSDVLIAVLEQKPDKKPEIIDDTRVIFTTKLQNVLDFLLDVREKRQQGVAGFAKISLFYLCIDELLTAFHLTQHAFVNQAYSHIRSIFENLDKIDLFHQQPEWCPFEHNYIWLCSFLLYTIIKMLLKITDVYAEYLNEEEIAKILDETV